MGQLKSNEATMIPLTLSVTWDKFRKQESPGLFRRHLIFKIKNPDRIVAEGMFIEWTSTGRFGDFLLEADDIDADEGAFANCCMSYWRGNPFRKGNLVHFKHLTSKAAAKEVNPMWNLIRRLISRSFENRASILLLQAMPLEYIGKDSNTVAFNQHLQAMCRHYAARMRAIALPIEGFDHWMWIPTGGPSPTCFDRELSA